MIENIEFRRVRSQKIVEEGLLPVDMHLHTNYSDSKTKVENLIKKAKKKQLGVAITDHNEIKGSLQAIKSGDIFTIPAIEINAQEGRDVLAYFYTADELKDFFKKHIERSRYKNQISRLKKDLATVLEKLEDYNCIVSAAHPFGHLWKNWPAFLKREGREDILKRVDAIEVMNGEHGRFKNLKAIEWCIELKKSYTAGSDGHALIQFGNVVTYAKANDVESFLNAVKKKKNFVQGVESKKLYCAFYHGIAIDKLIKHLPSTIDKHFKYSVKNRLEAIPPKIREKIEEMINEF